MATANVRNIDGHPKAYTPIGSHVMRTDLGVIQDVAIPVGANAIMIQSTVNSTRISFDGSDPTSSGYIINTDIDPVIFYLANTVPLIRLKESGATVRCQYQFLRVG